MKMGVRKPSLKKSLKARTTGKLKRSLKKSVNPLYGKKGMGMINNPKTAVYNKVYNKTTVSAAKVAGIEPQKARTNTSVKTSSTSASNEYNKLSKKQKKTFWTNLFLISLIILIIIFIISML